LGNLPYSRCGPEIYPLPAGLHSNHYHYLYLYLFLYLYLDLYLHLYL
jgi:hypothetical protein